jgi:hypothetical protein
MPFIDRTILDFLLYDWLDAAALTKLPRFSEHSRETFDAVLDLSARVADDHFAPTPKSPIGTSRSSRAKRSTFCRTSRPRYKPTAKRAYSQPLSTRRSAARKFPL